MCLVGGSGNNDDSSSSSSPSPNQLRYVSVAADELCLLTDIGQAGDMRVVSGVAGGMPLYSLAASVFNRDHFFCGAADGAVLIVDHRAGAGGSGVASRGPVGGNNAKTRWLPSLGSVRGEVTTGGHKDAVRSILTDIEGSRHTFLTAASDGLIKAWDQRQLSAGPSATFAVHTDAVRSLARVPGTSTFISGSRDGTIVGTNMSSMQSTVLVRTAFPPLHVGYSPRDDALLVTDTSSSVSVYDASSLLPSRFCAAAPGGSHTTAVTAAATDTTETANPISAVDSAANSPSKGKLSASTASSAADASKIILGGMDDASVLSSAAAAAADLNDLMAEQSQGDHHHRQVQDLVESGEERGLYHLPDVPRARRLPEAAQAEWSSAREGPWRQQDGNYPKPDGILAGTSGVCQCELLMSKKHVLAAASDGSLDLWDIVALKHLRHYPKDCGVVFRELADKLNGLFASHVGSWCSVTARWGLVCVTLSAEDYHSATLNMWENELHQANYRTITDDNPRVGPIRLDQMSHVVEGRHRRTSRRENFKNFGESVLRALFRAQSKGGGNNNHIKNSGDDPNKVSSAGSQKQQSLSSLPGAVDLQDVGYISVNPCTLCKVTVWSTVHHHTDRDRSAATVIPSVCLQGNTASDDQRIPTWVHAALQGAAAPTLSKVLIQCHPLPDKGGKKELPALPFRSDSWHYSAARTASLAELTGAVLRDLKINDGDLPFMREVNMTLEARNLPTLSEENVAEDGLVRPDEYLTFVAADKRTILDSLTTAYAAYVQHRTKGSTQLVLYYRPIVGGLKLRRGR